MKKLIKFRFFGEDIDHADDQPPEIRHSWGVGALFLSQENGETSSANLSDVDTTLGLSISPNSAISPLSSESDDVDSPAGNLDQDKLDYSTLSLSPPASPPLVFNPTPLRWFRPHSSGVNSSAGDVDQNQVGNSALNFSPPAPPTVEKSRKRGAAAGAAADGGGDQKRKKRGRPNDGEDGKKKKRRRRNDDEDQRALVPMREIGEVLLRAVESRGGSRPEFLYRKKLQAADVKRGLNRVFLTRGERVMGFLSEEEAAVVKSDDEKGLTVVGVDGGGKVYENLVMKLWESLVMVVIKSDWIKVVNANKAEKDDVMEIWGFRENGKPGLAFNFWRERENLERGGDHLATSMSSNGNGVLKN